MTFAFWGLHHKTALVTVCKNSIPIPNTSIFHNTFFSLKIFWSILDFFFILDSHEFIISKFLSQKKYVSIERIHFPKFWFFYEALFLHWLICVEFSATKFCFCYLFLWRFFQIINFQLLTLKINKGFSSKFLKDYPDPQIQKI